MTHTPQPTTRQLLDMSDGAANALVGMVVGHFSHSDVLDRPTFHRYVDEAEAVTK